MTKREYVYVAIGAAIAIALIWWFSRPAAAAPPCVPAYTQDAANDVGGQLASLTMLPLMLPMVVGAAKSEQDVAHPAKGLCTVVAVANHAAGLRQTKDTR